MALRVYGRTAAVVAKKEDLTKKMTGMPSEQVYVYTR